MSTIQNKIFNKLSATFLIETLKKWEAIIMAWNLNPKALNLYKEPKSGK